MMVRVPSNRSLTPMILKSSRLADLFRERVSFLRNGTLRAKFYLCERLPAGLNLKLSPWLTRSEPRRTAFLVDRLT